MNLQGATIPQNVLQINISPSRMLAHSEKKYKEDRLKETVSSICALLNSGGGKLELPFDRSSSRRHVHDTLRMIEQRCLEKLGMKTISHIKSALLSEKIVLNVKCASDLVSVSYNVSLPSHTQVISVPTNESFENVKELLKETKAEVNNVSIGSHRKQIMKGQNFGFLESNNVEYKNLKAHSSKRVTLADRITGKSNKLTSYVSAFANCSGGHIYYGVTDDGEVEGEEVSDKEKEEITRKVTKTITKMFWPQSEPRRGKQWDIFFEPVKDTNGNHIPSTFVIVIFVAPCQGVVFTEEPESYYISDGKVKRTSFRDCGSTFLGISKRPEFLSPPSKVPRVCWSSEKNRKFFHELTERLVLHRNDEDMNAFSSLSKLAIEKFPGNNADLIVKAERVVVAYKSYQFQKVESLLRELATLLTSSKDSSIFQVRMLLLQTVIERGKGNYEEAFKKTQDGLQMMQLIPVDLITVSFYIEAAMVTSIVSAMQHDLSTYRSLKERARVYLELAARDANSLEDLPSGMYDLQQKLHIYKAWILLECSVTGEEVQERHRISSEDIDGAARELAFVSESVLNGRPLTHFRKVQYDLAQSDLCRRRSEVFQEDNVGNLKLAFESCANARRLAEQHRFVNMMDFANKRLADLTEKLVRHALCSPGGHRSKNFLGYKY